MLRTHIIPSDACVSDAYHERDQTPLPVVLYCLFQSVSSQGQLLISGQEPDLNQRDQSCLLNGGMSLLKKRQQIKSVCSFHLIFKKLVF